MLIEQIKAGDSVEISLQRSDDSHTYSSRVEEKLNGELILVNTPVHQGEYIKLRQNERCKLLFITEKFMINYDSIVLKSYLKDGFSYLLYKVCSEGKRVQRRGFVRHECSVQFSFSIIKNNSNDPVNDAVKFDGTVKDISGGGMKFISSANFDENHSIKMFIKLDKETLLLFGKVLGKDNLTRTNQPFQYRVEFENLSDSDRDEVTQFIFNEQRKVFNKARA